MSVNLYDVVIIGAGPAGLTAGIFAHNKGLRVLVIDGARLGGQLRSLYPTKPVYNYPGYTQIEAGDLAEKMIYYRRLSRAQSGPNQSASNTSRKNEENQ